jgi:hypothetical protein
MPAELDTAGKYRRIADLLADDALEGTREAHPDFLRSTALAGKAALEAAAAADVSESEVAKVLAGMTGTLIAAGVVNDEQEAVMLSTVEVLRGTAAMGARAAALSRELVATRNAAKVLADHVRRLSAQAEASDGDRDSIDRVVARHRAAIDEAQRLIDEGRQG